MTDVHRRIHRTLACGIGALVLGGVLVAPVAGQETAPARTWSRSVWKSALNADAATLEVLHEQFDRLPVSALDAEMVDYFRSFRQRNLDNAQKANVAREAARSEAVGELHKHREAGELQQALLAAVKVQTFGENFDDAFKDEEILDVIAWCERELPRVEAASDWLEAQELVYRLRTLFEDTSRLDDYAKYDERLNEINRRVALLAKYAPRYLHNYQVERAKRLGEDPPPPFNEFQADDWQDRLKGVTARMLKAAMKKAAVEHIEDERWRPLLDGGIDELRLLATTPALAETFTSIGDEDKVGKWVDFLKQEQDALRVMLDDDMTSWTLSMMLDRVLKANEQTLNLPPELIYREFGDGAMYRLDKFSEIMWPDKLRRFEQATQGNFVGVGIIIRETETNDIMVVNPLEGSPAYYAGVKPNDLIVEVDGESTVGWSSNDAVDHITGEPDTPVTLGLKREGLEDVLPITINRQLIKLRSVFGWWKEKLNDNGDPKWDWFIDPTTRIAYMRLSQFTEDTFADILTAWREIEADGGANGLILDLRFNPGGLLVSAVQVSNLFVESGIILSAEDKEGNQAFPPQRASQRGAKLASLPTVVLINKGSASASEIVAGCLKAHGAAVIVGERSYGKGSVQTVHPVASNAQLKLTTQYYRLPPNEAKGETKGRIVHKRPRSMDWGVDPDIRVPMTPAQNEEAYFLRQNADIIPEEAEKAAERPDVADLITKGIDPQLETALLILQARVLGEIDGLTKHASIR